MPPSDVTIPARPYHPRSAGSDWANRITRCVAGLACFGAGIGLILEAELGAAPWDVFHQGVSERTGVSIGTVIIAIGVLLLLLWIPLRQRPGLGTLLNAVEIGLAVDLTLALVPDTERLALRVPFLALGIVVVALGSGLYIGSGLGVGPRDGIMMGLRDRGISVARARTVVEVVVLVAGVALGGTIGLGTVAFTFGIGPLVQVFLPWFHLPPRRPR